MPSIQLSDPELLRNAAYINGKWVPASTNKTFNITDPATEQVIGTMPDMDARDADIAIQAAAAALPKFRKTTARSKARILYKWYQLLVENVEDLASLVTAENGKPLQEARNEVLYAAQYFEWFSGEAIRLDGETIHASEEGNRIHTVREPIGVVGLVTPWNWPIGVVTRKVGPALAAGCTIVLKSPGETPLTAAAMAYLGEKAGVPSGVLNIVTALENTVEVGRALTESSIVKKVSFTGSTRCYIELGGNAPFIVFEGAHFYAAVAGAVTCKFRSSGQTCICANRIYVHNSIYDAFAKAFAEKVSKFTIGPGSQKGVTHGPLIHSRAMDKAKEHTEDALQKGGKLLHGGHAMPFLGPNFFELTVVGNATPDMKIAHEETFGPVAALFPFETEEQVIERANDSDVGLAGYFYSQNIHRCYRVAEALEVGMVGISTGIVSGPVMPFGGVKESGFGREGSRQGIDEYIVTKAVTLGGCK